MLDPEGHMPRVKEGDGLPPGTSKAIQCHKCGRDNAAEQAFCGACGSPLALDEFISKRVSEHLANAIRDRDVIETESSIRVFERAWGWVKIVGGIAAVLLAILGAGVFWKVSDWKSTVDSAKASVTNTATTAQQEIKTSSATSLRSIQSTADDVKKANDRVSETTKQQSRAIQREAAQTKSELGKESASVKNEVSSAHTQLQAAAALRPEMETTQKQLQEALAQVQAQQKLISSSQNFVKEIFGSYTTNIVQVDLEPKPQYVVMKPAPGQKVTFIYILLSSAPIQGTVQLQWHVFSEPRGSYFALIHNLLIDVWGDPPQNLHEHAFEISYFPDSSDKDLIKTLTVKDGRVYADGEPLPKLGQVDTDFKGNKWMPAQPQPTAK
jgi:hypothetical protein